MTSCMGGWCHKRDTCARYRQDDRQRAAERLCAANMEWFVQWQPAEPKTETSTDGEQLASDSR